ncbi:MAG: hypothetical protein HY437_00755 [Candidatus Magasanikbacteria bacterium]|nr:hypothetical protein [Candidatus Magasanikbacteria bacterium]
MEEEFDGFTGCDCDDEGDYPDELEAEDRVALTLLNPADNEVDWSDEMEDWTWESAKEREEAALEAREVELEMVQKDIERRNFRKISWQDDERILFRTFRTLSSWKHQRRARRSWVREDLWRGQHRRNARAFARELDRRAMVMAMGEWRPWYTTPTPEYKI